MFASGWLYAVLLSIGAIVVCTAMELLSVAFSFKVAGKPLYANPVFKGEEQHKAA